MSNASNLLTLFNKTRLLAVILEYSPCWMVLMAHPPCTCKRDAHTSATSFVMQMQLGCPALDFPHHLALHLQMDKNWKTRACALGQTRPIWAMVSTVERPSSKNPCSSFGIWRPKNHTKIGMCTASKHSIARLKNARQTKINPSPTWQIMEHDLTHELGFGGASFNNAAAGTCCSVVVVVVGNMDGLLTFDFLSTFLTLYFQVWSCGIALNLLSCAPNLCNSYLGLLLAPCFLALGCLFLLCRGKLSLPFIATLVPHVIPNCLASVVIFLLSHIFCFVGFWCLALFSLLELWTLFFHCSLMFVAW